MCRRFEPAPDHFLLAVVYHQRQIFASQEQVKPQHFSGSHLKNAKSQRATRFSEKIMTYHPYDQAGNSQARYSRTEKLANVT